MLKIQLVNGSWLMAQGSPAGAPGPPRGVAGWGAAESLKILENQHLGIFEILNNYGAAWKINILESLKSSIIIVQLGKSISWNL